MTGFELEDRQCVGFRFNLFGKKINDFLRYLLRYEVSQTKGQRTSKQLADVQEKRNALHCLIQNWREIQLVYTPHVALLLSEISPPPETTTTTTNALPSTLPENIPLYLPSALPPHIRALPDLQAICHLEKRLREPMADDALAEIRHHRR